MDAFVWMKASAEALRMRPVHRPRCKEEHAMGHAVKFLHASDFHLECAVESLAEIPPHLKTTLANAPFLAVENLVQLAIAEQVDFMLLAGDVLDIDAGGPRAATFLATQMERLAERNIPVFWCSGQVDRPDRWPAAVPLPANVTTFTSTGFERVPVIRSGQPIATVFGTGYFSSRRGFDDLKIAADEVFPIALVHDPAESAVFEATAVRYWAIGGRHQRSSLERENGWVVAPGSPQARNDSESGPHSCAVVRVDESGKIGVDAVAVDVVRWLPQGLSFSESASDDDVKNLFADRCFKIAADSPEQLVLVRWTLATTGPFVARWRNSQWRRQMIQWLRTEFGGAAKGIWTVDLDFDSVRTLPQSWYDEDTMLGDFLRTIGKMQGESEQQMTLDAFVGATGLDDAIADLPRLDRNRETVFRTATMFGVEQLGAFADER
jgi:hypothetical protein